MKKHDGIQFKFSVPTKKLWARAKNASLWVLLITIIFTVIVFATSKNAHQDALITFFFCLIFGLLFNLLRFVKYVNSVVFDRETITIEAIYLNKPITEKIKYEDLRLSIQKLHYYQISAHAGFRLSIINKDGRSYLIEDDGVWTTQTIYKILKEIKSRREQKCIKRNDGTFFIPEIEEYLKKRSL
jgi:hypothetical protein